MKRQFLKKTIASALISGATILVPSMCEKQVYSNSSTVYNSQYELAEIGESIRRKNLEEIIKKEREFLFSKKALEQNSDNIKAPYIKVKKDRCAEYAVKAAYKLFNKKYNRENAWNLQYVNKEGSEIDSIGAVKELIIDGYLTPGMLIGTKREMTPGQLKRYGKDLDKNPPEYTHVVTYVGINSSNEPEFVQQFGRTIEKLTLSQLEEKGLIPVEVIDSPDLTEIAQN